MVNESDEQHLEPFKEKMANFLETATTSLKELDNLIHDCSKKFEKIISFYNFSPKAIDGPLQPKDFFLVWLPFCQDYKNVWKKEQLCIEKELLKEARLKYKLKKDSLKNEIVVVPKKPGGLKDKMMARKRKNNT